MKTVYFILGMHRSGTSALAGVLNLLGLELGSDLMQATEMNPKGYFENILTYGMNEKILIENNSSWDNYHFNIDSIPQEKRESYKNEIKKIIESEFRYAEKFVVKDPRICLLFPIWESACLDLNIDIKIILPYRNPIEITNSLKKRNGFSFEKSLILWAHHFLSAEYLSRKYKRIYISFDELLNNTKNTVDKLYGFTAINTNKRKRKSIDEFLDIGAKHNNSALENFTKETPKFLQRLLYLLKESQFDKLDTIDDIRNEFYYSLEMFHHTELLKTIDNEKTQKAELERLDKKVKLLESIKDTAIFNEEYYIQKYVDVKDYKGSMNEHYYKYGKNEGRIPNQYCEYFNIDAKEIISNSEIVYLQENQIKQKTQELEIKNNTIIALQEQKNKLTQNEQELSQKIVAINQKTDKLLSVLETLKKQKQQIEELLNTEKKSNNKLNSLYQDLQTQVQRIEESSKIQQKDNNKLNTINQNQEKQLKQKSKKLEDNSKTIQALEKQKAILIQTQQQNLQELVASNQNINKALNTVQSNNIILQKRNSYIQELKTQKNRLEESLNVKRGKINGLKTKIQEGKQQLKKSLNAKQSMINELNIKNQELKNNKQRIIKIQEKNTSLYTELKLKIKEIEELNIQINEIIEDLVSIKESKCWIYTKPIRNLQMIFKD